MSHRRSCRRAQSGTTRHCLLLLINGETGVRDGDIARRSAEASDVLRAAEVTPRR
jgi:hypothetical protein